MGDPWMLYTRPGCHLCEEAEAWLEDLAAERSATLVLVNILADPAAYEAYKWRIPVLVAEGRTWEAPLDRQAVSAAIQGPPAAG